MQVEWWCERERMACLTEFDPGILFRTIWGSWAQGMGWGRCLGLVMILCWIGFAIGVL